MKQKKIAAIFGITLFVTATIASAEDQIVPPESSFQRFCEQDYLLGDWGGWRTDLSKHGVDFEFFYAGSVANNLDGGKKTGSLYQGALLMTLDLDSEKLVGYEGGTFHAGALWLNGAKPFSDDYVGDLNKVNLVDFPNSFRLWELWYQQQFFGGKFSFKFGDLVVDHDFIVPDYYNSLASINFLNQTFFYPTMAFDVYDVPGFPPQHHGLPSTPYAAPGVVARWAPAPQFYAQAAVYSGDPDQTSSGTRFNLSETEGALSYYEIGYHLNQQKDDTGLGGSYKLGAWFHTGDFDDVYDGVFSAALTAGGFPASPVGLHQYNYGAYFLAEQQLYREIGKDDPAQQGLVGFFRVAGAPADRNLAQFGVDGGLVYKGLIPKRDWDTLGLAASYLEISDDIRHAQRDINTLAVGLGGSPPFAKLADYEGVIELNYKAQLTAWWTIQPSLQRVFHPGGRISADIPDAWVFIVQTTLRF
ncbi:MAG: carbohydrate porin [Limisphaerales bacterium]